jgi:hypothetical protein
MRENAKSLTKYEEGFFEIWTASQLNHKYARFVMSIFLENGLAPNFELIRKEV